MGHKSWVTVGTTLCQESWRIIPTLYHGAFNWTVVWHRLLHCDIAYKTVREHSPSDADQSGGQGSTKQISTFETSTIRKATASDSSAQLERVKIRQPARLAEEDRDTSALRAGDPDTMALPSKKEEMGVMDYIFKIYSFTGHLRL